MKSLIDHVISNYPLRVAHPDVLPAPSVSNHDNVYMIINAWVTRYAPRHKYIRNEKQLDMQVFKQNFLSLPLNVIYGLKSPEDMVDALNSFVTECLDRHTPLKKVKRPPASWMASDEIRELQTTRDKLRAQARCCGTDETWTAFRTVRNRINAVIGKAKTEHFGTLLSRQSDLGRFGFTPWSTIMYPQRIWHLSGHCCNLFQQSPNPCQKH